MLTISLVPKKVVRVRKNGHVRAEDEDELGDDINDGTNKRPEDVDDPESERLRVVESGDLLERRNGDEERHSEYDERRHSQKLRAG